MAGLITWKLDVRWKSLYLLVLVGRAGMEDNERVVCRRCSAERTLMPDRDRIDRLRVFSTSTLNTPAVDSPLNAR